MYLLCPTLAGVCSQMMEAPLLAADIGGRFDHVLVDEYQDTNRLQAQILLRLKPDGSGLTVVGDDAQSIYGFRAATVRNILDFPGLFSPPARLVTLERNYRSTQPILAACNAVMDQAAERFTKNLYSDRPSAQRPLLVTLAGESEQAAYVAECAQPSYGRMQGIEAYGDLPAGFRARHGPTSAIVVVNFASP